MARKAVKKTAKKTAVKGRAKPTTAKKETPEVEVAPKGSEGKKGPFRFRSPHPGLRQILKPGGYEILGPNDHMIVPPLLAEFEAVRGGKSGEWMTEKPELAELMRAKIARKTIKDVVEVTGEPI